MESEMLVKSPVWRARMSLSAARWDAGVSCVAEMEGSWFDLDMVLSFAGSVIAGENGKAGRLVNKKLGQGGSSDSSWDAYTVSRYIVLVFGKGFAALLFIVRSRSHYGDQIFNETPIHRALLQ